MTDLACFPRAAQIKARIAERQRQAAAAGEEGEAGEGAAADDFAAEMARKVRGRERRQKGERKGPLPRSPQP